MAAELVLNDAMVDSDMVAKGPTCYQVLLNYISICIRYKLIYSNSISFGVLG